MVGVESVDPVLEELTAVPVLKVDVPVVPVGEVEFRVLSVGPNSRSKLSKKSDQLINYTDVFRSKDFNKQTNKQTKRAFLYLTGILITIFKNKRVKNMHKYMLVQPVYYRIHQNQKFCSPVLES